MYPIFETELKMISMFNIISTLFFSGAAASFSIGFTLYLEKQVTPDATPAGELLMSVGPKLFCVLGAISLVLALISAWKRGSILSQIKEQVVQRNTV